MPTFDGGSVVDPMICKLPQAGFEGVIPEPSTVQVQAFMNAQRLERERIRQELTGIPDDEPLETTLERLGPEQVEVSVRRNAEMYAALCSGTPSADDLVKLPHRVFAAFANWVSEEILNPEAASGAGNEQGQTPPSAAAA